MKKNAFYALVLALIFLLCQFSFPVAIAAVEADRCDSGDHDYELLESNDYGMGMPIYFTVNSCDSYPFAHQHYRIEGYVQLIYVCRLCGDRKDTGKSYVVSEYANCCAYNDVGR
mgnify:CR=1 FL=1